MVTCLEWVDNGLCAVTTDRQNCIYVMHTKEMQLSDQNMLKLLKPFYSDIYIYMMSSFSETAQLITVDFTCTSPHV